MCKDHLEKSAACLFDLDGTLIDSMGLHYKTWAAVLKRYDITLNERRFYLEEGTNIYSLMNRYLLQERDSGLTEQLIKEKDLLYIQQASFDLYPGAWSLLTLLRTKNKKLGLVTASSRYRLTHTLSDRLLDWFDVIVTSDDVTNGKPCADPYNKAISELGVSAEDAVVFENAPLGVKAGNAAGTVTVAIGNTLKREDLLEAHYYYDDYESLLREVC